MMEHNLNYPNNNHWIFRNAILHYLNDIVIIGDWPPYGPNDDDDCIQVIPVVVD